MMTNRDNQCHKRIYVRFVLLVVFFSFSAMGVERLDPAIPPPASVNVVNYIQGRVISLSLSRDLFKMGSGK